MLVSISHLAWGRVSVVFTVYARLDARQLRRALLCTAHLATEHCSHRHALTYVPFTRVQRAQTWVPILVHYPLRRRSGMETAQPVKCLPCEQKNLVLYTQHPHKKPDMGQQDGSVGKITWCKSLSGPEFDTQNDPNLQEEN